MANPSVWNIVLLLAADTALLARRLRRGDAGAGSGIPDVPDAGPLEGLPGGVLTLKRTASGERGMRISICACPRIQNFTEFVPASARTRSSRRGGLRGSSWKQAPVGGVPGRAARCRAGRPSRGRASAGLHAAQPRGLRSRIPRRLSGCPGDGRCAGRSQLRSAAVHRFVHGRLPFSKTAVTDVDDPAAHREIPDDRHAPGLAGGDQIVEDLVRHGLVKDAAVAEFDQVVFQRLELEAELVGMYG